MASNSSYFPLAGIATDGWSNETSASATCYCGKIQISVPIVAPGLVDSFLCNCFDCRKITASQFASNFIVLASHVKFIRGEQLLKVFEQATTIKSGGKMANHFCVMCGTLMYRISEKFAGHLITRLGTVDDFKLQETKLKPRVEQYVECRTNWLLGAKGIKQVQASAYKAKI